MNIGGPEILIVLIVFVIPALVILLIIKAVTAASAKPSVPAATWAPDPYGRAALRFFDGVRWTEHVATDGVVGVDPVV